MPTGYTADVVDGKVTDFPTFALQCARAFGALIMMRDDPADKPIPDAFKPSTFAERSAITARTRLEQLRAMTPDQIERAYSEKIDEVARENAEHEREAAERRGRLNAMLAQVEAWDPPTSGHVELKNFMREQLLETLKWDGEAHLAQVPGADARTWHEEQVTGAVRDIEHYENSQREENELTATRNEVGAGAAGVVGGGGDTVTNVRLTTHERCPRCGHSLAESSCGCSGCGWPVPGRVLNAADRPQGYDAPDPYAQGLPIRVVAESYTTPSDRQAAALERIAAALEDIAHISGALHHKPSPGNPYDAGRKR